MAADEEQMMATAEEIAQDFEAANSEAVTFAEGCSPGQWSAIVPGEDWTVGVVLRHIAAGHDMVTGWIGLVAAGQGVPDSREGIDAANAANSAAWAGMTVEEVVSALRANSAGVVAAIRSLSDEDLEAERPFGPAEGREFTIGQIAGLAARHARGHLEHAREAAAAAGAGGG